MKLTYITRHLNSHEKCIEYLENKRWGKTTVCPYCGSEKSSPKKLRHTCHGCKRSFSVTVGTVFQNSNLPLQKWLMAIAIMMSAKKGVSSMQLSRDLSVNKNTAWLLQMKIRAAMKDGELQFFKSEKRKVRITLTGKFGGVKRRKSYQGEDDGRPIQRGCWNHLKRAIIGQYHRIDEHYLHRYVDEIHFKYDRKHLPDSGYSELLRRSLFLE